MNDVAPGTASPTGSTSRQGIALPIQWLVILALAAVPTLWIDGEVISALPPVDDSGIDRLSLAEALNLSQVVWIDARPRHAYNQGHIPGALPLSEDTWETDLVEVLMLWNPGDTAVVYCGSASCDASEYVARRLMDKIEFDSVAVLDGGWDAYETSKR